jgi:hypothetical protein
MNLSVINAQSSSPEEVIGCYFKLARKLWLKLLVVLANGQTAILDCISKLRR